MLTLTLMRTCVAEEEDAHRYLPKEIANLYVEAPQLARSTCVLELIKAMAQARPITGFLTRTAAEVLVSEWIPQDEPIVPLGDAGTLLWAHSPLIFNIIDFAQEDRTRIPLGTLKPAVECVLHFSALHLISPSVLTTHSLLNAQVACSKGAASAQQ